MRISLVSISNYGHEPTSLLYLASYLNSKTHHKSTIIDRNWTPNLVRATLESEPDIVGISAMTCDYEDAAKFAVELKRAKPHLSTVIGGIHISCLPESFRSCFDHKVLGEGETGLPELLDSIKRNGKLDLINYPPLDRRLLNSNYWSKKFHTGLFTYESSSVLMGSRGCPYNCIFCASPVFWQGYRSFSTPWIINELKDMMLNRGITYVVIFDDVFTCNIRRLKEFVEAKAKAGLDNLTLSINSRSSLITDETCELLKSANVKSIMFGWESGNQRILNLLKGNAVSIRDNINSVKLCKKHNLLMTGGIIFGTPTETWKEKLDSIKFIWQAWWNGAIALAAFQLVPLPGTLIWKNLEKEGKVSSAMNFDSIEFRAGVNLNWWVKLMIWFPITAMKFRKCLIALKRLM